MASLLKFKLLPSHCGVSPTPTLSPNTSPLLLLRRRKTLSLRMLLTRRPPRRRSLPETKNSSRTNKLKDLFVSSPPYEPTHARVAAAPIPNVTPVSKDVDGKIPPAGFIPGSPRPGWTGFRYKCLLRKTWRPVLAGIPE